MRRATVLLAALLAACGSPGGPASSAPSAAPASSSAPASAPSSPSQLSTSCTGLGVTSSPNGPQPPGTTVLFTASVQSCPSPLYQFWVIAPNGVGLLMQSWSASTGYSWSTATGSDLGVYTIKVEARDSSDANLEQSISVLYTLGSAPPERPCASLAVTTDRKSPQLPGATVVFTAGVRSCPSPLYRFWVIGPNGVGLLVQDWSSAATYTWSATAGSDLGVYTIKVDVRDSNDANIEQSVSVAYTLGSAPATNPCTGLAVASFPSSPQLVGTTIVFTASVSSCRSPIYKFWLIASNGVGTLMQDWSASASYAWNGEAGPGTYTLRVEVRDSSDANIEQTATTLYTLT